MMLGVLPFVGGTCVSDVHAKDPAGEVSRDQGSIGQLLQTWYDRGSAAGNIGDFYDNRDRGHSALALDPYPQLQVVTYSAAQRQRRLDWGASQTVLPHVTFGNSSTAAEVTQGGSITRLFFSNPRGMNLLYQQYTHNNLYLYPEVRDYDPGRNGRPGYGDLFPTNTPYVIIPQGASGSDQPFMQALPLILGAFRPEVKTRLRQSGLLMPTVQMLFRLTNRHLTQPTDYLSGIAHPSAFDGDQIDRLQMVRLAHFITPDNIPPMVQLNVVKENLAVQGHGFFDPLQSERLADTPAVIARVVRGPDYVRRLVVSAENSYDLNHHPLTYHWVILRGDAKRIQITPLNDNRSVVDLQVAYHPRQALPGTSAVASNRVDIGVFVHNGSFYSAPGFVTFFSLDHEARTYDEHGRLVEIGYDAGDTQIGYDDDGQVLNRYAYDIVDWQQLFELLGSTQRSLAVQLVQQQFRPAELALLHQVGNAFQRASTRQQVAQAFYEQTEARHKHGQASANELTHATQLLDHAREATLDVLIRHRESIGTSAKRRLEQGLNAIKNTWTLYPDHMDDLQAIAAAMPDKEHRAAFDNTRQALIDVGLLQPQSDGRYRLNPIRASAAPLAKRLTTYERLCMERLNLAIMNHLLYASFLKRPFQVNFVDPRLALPKFWRDVYHDDAQGNQIGWRRYGQGRQDDFTPGGLLVLEKDALGRPLQAAEVTYAIAQQDPPHVVWTPGHRILHFHYTSPHDRLGQIVKETATDTVVR